MKLAYRLLSSGHNAIVTPTLDLLSTIGSIDGSLNELLFGGFDFSLKTMPKFAFMRKKTLAQGERWDIRSAYVHFLLMFVEHGNYATKLALAKMQNLIGPIFAGLPDDPLPLVQYFLETIQKGIIGNEKRSKTLTLAFVYSSSLGKVSKLYESSDPTIVDIADVFLREVCTNTDTGLCFRSSEADVTLSKPSGLRNKILLDVLLAMNPLESLRKQQLFIEIFTACPDIIGPYWIKSNFSFEPEPTARFFNLVSFAIKLLQVPVTPALYEDINEIVPKGLNASNIQRGLLHSNRMVAFFMAVLLKTVLMRMESFVKDFEWRCSPQCSNLVIRNQLIQQLSSKIPSGKETFQVYSQNLKLDASSRLLGELLAIMEASSRLFASYPEHGIGMVKFDTTKMIDIPQYWSYLAESCAFDIADMPFIAGKLSSFQRNKLIGNYLLKHGLASSAEQIQFICQSDNQTMIPAIQQLKQKRFFSAQSNPLIDLLGQQESFETFTKKSRVATVPLDVAQYSLDKQTEEANDDSTLALAPLITGSSMSSVFEEIMSSVKLDVVAKAISRSSFDKFTQIQFTMSNEQLTDLLLSTYDYSAWIQFLAQMMTNSEMVKSIDIRIYIESGVLAFPLHGLSSSDENLWRASHFVLHSFYELLQSARFRERKEIMLVMDCLRNSLHESVRLPTVHAVFLSEMMQVLLRPAHFMYPVIMEFLLANHSLDIKRIPLMIECICSSTDMMSRQQVWMLRILIAGTRKGTSYSELYGFSHVWPTVQTLLQLPHLDSEVDRLCQKLMSKLATDSQFRESIIPSTGPKTWMACLPSRLHSIDSLMLL